MLNLLALLFAPLPTPLAQLPPFIPATPKAPAAPRYLVERQQVRPLPGGLNTIPVLHSNSPEIVTGDGILLSTFSTDGKPNPSAHLDRPLSGRFDLFAHHIFRAPNERRPLHHAVLVYNPSNAPVTLQVLQGVSHTNADSPFISLPSLVEDPNGTVFSGPGSRVMGEVLRGLNEAGSTLATSDIELPERLTLAPQEYQLLLRTTIPLSSGRTTYLRLQSDGPVQAAVLAQYPIQIPVFLPTALELSPQAAPGPKPGPKPGPSPQPTPLPPPAFILQRDPVLADWVALLNTGGLGMPRDRAATPPNGEGYETVLGRVAGVAMGNEWAARVTDNPGDPAVSRLTIPLVGQSFSYPIAASSGVMFGLGQVQSGTMVGRYGDTAYFNHGNYGVAYNLRLPLSNPTALPRRVVLKIQTPFKQPQRDRLLFVEPPMGTVFFRGVVRVSYLDEGGGMVRRFFHVSQREGERGEPLVSLRLPPGGSRVVEVGLLYPPDATPPQVLTVETVE